MAKKENKEKKSLFFTVEVFGMAITLFCVLGFTCLVSGDSIFGNIGLTVQRFFLGVFGYVSFPFLLFFAYIGIKMLIGFKLNAPYFKKACLYLFLYFLLSLLIVQTVYTDPGETYGEYLSYCYNNGLSLASCPAGGMFLGLICYPVEKFTTSVGAYIIYGGLIAVTSLVLFRKFIFKAPEEKPEKKKHKKVKNENAVEDSQLNEEENSISSNDSNENGFETPKKQVIFGGGQFEMRSKKDGDDNERSHLKVLFGGNGNFTQRHQDNSSSPLFEMPSYRDSYDVGMESKTQFVREGYSGQRNESSAGGVTSPMGGRNEEFDFTRDRSSGMDINISQPQSTTYVVNEGGRERDGIGAFESRRQQNPSYDGNFERGSSFDGQRGSYSGGNSFDRNNSSFDRNNSSFDRGGERATSFDRSGESSSNPFDRSSSTFDRGGSFDRNNSSFDGVGRENQFERGQDNSSNESFQSERGSFSRTPEDNGESLKRKPFMPFSGESRRMSEEVDEGHSRTSERDSQLNSNADNDENHSGITYNGPKDGVGFDRTNEDNVASHDDYTLRSQKPNPIEKAKILRESRGTTSNYMDGVDNTYNIVPTPSYNQTEHEESEYSRNDEEITSNAGSYFSAEERKPSRVTPSRDYSHKPEVSDNTSYKGSVSSSSSTQSEIKSNDTQKPEQGKQIKMSDIPDKNQLKNPIDNIPKNYRYNFPPSNLLCDYRPDKQKQEETKREQEERKSKIINTLATGGIEAKIEDVKVGPAITRFEISIPLKVPVKRVLEKERDLNLWLSSRDKIRIVAPIIGTSRIGIEVPNTTLSIVGLRGLIEDPEFKNAKRTSMTFCFGRDIVGRPIYQNIAKMPHLLVAGATGTGKSVFLNTLLVSLMYKYSPQDLRIILVDPKIVEFTLYRGIPNLMFDEIFTKIPRVRAMLEWVVKEMDRRYEKMEEVLVRDLDDYNTVMESKHEQKLPKILVIIDEFADIMNNSSEENVNDQKLIGKLIEKLSSKARSAGIHLILATQRPSADIVDGAIKTNFVSRIAFKMASSTDAGVIMGESGAEKLLGAGDVMYRTGKMSSSERAQGCFVDTPEIERVCRYVKEHNTCYFDEFALDEINEKSQAPEVVVSTASSEGDGDSRAKNDDELLKSAMRIAITTQTISISALQRKLSIGFPKAGKIVDTLTEMGYISDLLDNKKRKIIMTKEQFEDAFGEPL